ncbi:restriction endonuclease subunit S [Desulfovibrio piger]|uniref:restriction endonuclease subunit S n=1 Tax=Desulfovibrio piger TaxID=901 RepID=UPI0026EA534C|nr:restriction endonuclease subunit S [Desulfovibrio piger]
MSFQTRSKVYEQGNAIKKTIYYGHYYITRNKYNELSAFSVKWGDIIISCAGTIGEIYKLPESCENGVINQALMRVRTYKNIDENFFEYYFTGVLKNNVIDQANGTAIRNIPPFKILKAMPIILPSLPEQQEIVRILDRIFAKEQQAREAAENVLQRIDQMKKAILARAFRGELD